MFLLIKVQLLWTMGSHFALMGEGSRMPHISPSALGVPLPCPHNQAWPYFYILSDACLQNAYHLVLSIATFH
jgi:hypothetical protein